jgi:hypothetical protein
MLEIQDCLRPIHLTLKFPRNKAKNKGDNFYQKSFNLGNPSGFSPSLGYLLVHLAQNLMSSREKVVPCRGGTQGFRKKR